MIPTKPYKLWEVNENNYPTNGSQEEQLRFILQYAILAPNSHNTQPWKFKIDASKIKIFPNFSRNLPYSDRGNRQLYISLGCALANLLVALEHFGFSADELYLPEDDIEHTAVVIEVNKEKVRSHYSDLFPQIIKRVTNRFPYDGSPIKEEILDSILRYNTENNIFVKVVTDSKIREKIKDIAEEASKYVYSDAVFKEELGQWLRSVYTSSNDGMPLFDLPVPGFLTTFAPYVMREMPARLESKRDKALFASSPAFLLIHSTSNDKETWLKVGKVFELISLALTKEGVSHAPWAGVIEHDKSKEKIKKLLNISDNPLFFVRMGYAKKIPHHSPRRQLADVIL